MVANIITIAVVLAVVGFNVYKMAQNVKNGKSIDGCDGDCSHCSSAKQARVHGKKNNCN